MSVVGTSNHEALENNEMTFQVITSWIQSRAAGMLEEDCVERREDDSTWLEKAKL
ncbi:hypothetical protein FRC03_008216 [Tulasnella sp. 419]|nr:hypothetical protein FRC03_008216 [Tulasnella sp. 419]